MRDNNSNKIRGGNDNNCGPTYWSQINHISKLPSHSVATAMTKVLVARSLDREAFTEMTKVP